MNNSIKRRKGWLMGVHTVDIEKAVSTLLRVDGIQRDNFDRLLNRNNESFGILTECIHSIEFPIGEYQRSDERP